MGRRWFRLLVILVGLMRAGVLGRFRVGRRCRCSMPITLCGSAVFWGSLPIPAVLSLVSCGIGNRRWWGWLIVYRCLLIGLIRWWLIIVGLAWLSIGLRRYMSGWCGWLVSIT